MQREPHEICTCSDVAFKTWEYQSSGTTSFIETKKHKPTHGPTPSATVVSGRKKFARGKKFFDGLPIDMVALKSTLRN